MIKTRNPAVAALQLRDVARLHGKSDPEPSAPPTPTEKCGECAFPLIPRRGEYFACVLPKGHEGEHRGGGTCFKHGEYIGEPNKPPQCPEWPNCITILGNMDASHPNLTYQKAIASADSAVSPPVRETTREDDAIATTELAEWGEKVKDSIFYARVAARSKGYALAVHGTLRRDVDVVAVPWTDEACAPDELMESVVEYLRSVGVCYGGDDTGTLAHARQTREEKPFGRIAYALPLKGIPAPYLDLSVAPRASSPSSPEGAADRAERDADTKRLDWLEMHLGLRRLVTLAPTFLTPAYGVVGASVTVDDVSVNANGLRAALDAAMQSAAPHPETDQ